MNPAPRILHVITSLERGGAETVLARLVEASSDVEHVGVVTLRGGATPLAERIAAAGVPIYPLGEGSIVGLWSRWRRIVARSQPQLLHAWLIHPSILLTLLPRRLPLVIAIRHALDDLTGEKRLTVAMIRALAWLGRRADRICYVSRIARRQHEAIGYPSGKGTVIPNDYVTDGLPIAPAGREQLLAALALPADAVLIGQLARVHPIKGHDLLLDAFAAMASAFPQARLVLIGAGTNDPEGPAATRAAALGIADRLHALGERNDVPTLLSGLDFLVNPSRSEAFPNAVAEAMLAGLPCIASDVGDTGAIMGGNGVLVPAGDPTALAEAMRDMCQRSAARRRAMGEAARAHVVAEFGLDTMARRYAALYREILDERPRDALRLPTR